MTADYSNLLEAILGELKRRGAPVKVDDLAASIGLSRFDKRALRDQLDRLVKNGEAVRVGNKRYRFHSQKPEPQKPDTLKKNNGPKTQTPARDSVPLREKLRNFPSQNPPSPQSGRNQSRGQQPSGRSQGPYQKPSGMGARGRDERSRDNRDSDNRGGGNRPREREEGFTRSRYGEGELITGVYAQTRSGVGYVQPVPVRKDVLDIVIPEGMQGGAMHGDTVKVDVREGASGRRVGRVAEIVVRGRRFIAGTLTERRNNFFCEPLDDRIQPVDLGELDLKYRKDLGSVILVSFDEPEAGAHGLLKGEIKRVLGDLEHPDVQFGWIVAEFRLPEAFPKAVLKEAEDYGSEIKPADLKNREDLRKLPIVTIDGEDAKDFDDAVLVERNGKGYRLLVSIADVSHYVRPGTALDDEALERGTSVYFPGRVIPMLPEGLSNELCSLKPDVDRLTLTCEIEYDSTGKQLAKKVYESVIRNHARMTYTKVQQLLDKTSAELTERYRDHLPHFELMNELAHKLLADRMRSGAVDLELPEIRYDLDGTGRAVGMSMKPRLFAHRIIEEFMLAANRAVAEIFTDAELPFVYRIHEPPDPVKVDAVNEILAPFGVQIEYKDIVRPKDVQKAADSLKGKPVERSASMMILRSLKQARYDPKNEGHFGLAFEDYTHFTSPIRRYPDLEVHRLVRMYLRSEIQAIRSRGDKLKEICVRSSERERLAMTAERAFQDIKTAEFMQAHLFAEFEGTVTSVTKFGFYVSIDDFGAEGIVPLDGIDTDRYRLSDDGAALVGAKTAKTFAVGDRVRVQAVDASLSRRRITFRWMKTTKRVSAAGLRRVDRGGKNRKPKEDKGKRRR